MPRIIVAVVGATGFQGGSVASELLKSPEIYQVRAITRDVSKPSAQSLLAQGADVRSADLNDGVEALAQVFAGAHVVFGLTDFWATVSSVTEMSQGRNLVDAVAASSSVTHFLWSALPDPVALSRGNLLNIHHWKSKSNVTEYIKEEHPDLWAKTTVILFPNYFENCLTQPKHYLPLKVSEIYVRSFLHSTTTVLPNVSIADTGKLVHILIQRCNDYFGKTIAFYSQALSEAEKLRIMGKVLGVTTEYKQITPREFQESLMKHSSMAEGVALDFTEQLMLFEDFGNVYASEEFIQASEIPGLSLQTWDEFIREHDLLEKIHE